MRRLRERATPGGWLLLAVLATAAGETARAGTAGFGVIGDSVADEYQFQAEPLPAARNFVEQLAADRGLDFGALSNESRGGPRGRGYEFNWARSGARTSDLAPQVQGLAEQAAAGRVDRVMVFVGGNNFRDVLTGRADAAEAYETGVTNTVAAVTNLLLADPDVRVAVANVPDVTLLPEARAAVAQDPSLGPRVQKVTSLIDTYNAALATQFEQNRRVAVVDAHGLFDELAAGRAVGSVVLEPLTPSTDPSHLFVDPVHPGTVAQGLLGEAFLRALGGLDDIGGTPAPPPEPPVPQPPAAIPLPAPVWAALGIGPLVLLFARRLARAGRTG